MSEQWKSARQVGDIDWAVWRACDPATLVFVVEDDRLLLIHKKRGLGAGKINGPGGRMEPGETPLQCGIREVQEELLITPRDLRARGENRFQFTDGYSIHVHIFTAATYTGTPGETEEAIPLWCPIADIPYARMWEDDRLWVPLMLAGRPFSGRFIFDGDRMVDHQIDSEA